MKKKKGKARLFSCDKLTRRIAFLPSAMDSGNCLRSLGSHSSEYFPTFCRPSLLRRTTSGSRAKRAREESKKGNESPKKNLFVLRVNLPRRSEPFWESHLSPPRALGLSMWKLPVPRRTLPALRDQSRPIPKDFNMNCVPIYSEAVDYARSASSFSFPRRNPTQRVILDRARWRRRTRRKKKIASPQERGRTRVVPGTQGLSVYCLRTFRHSRRHDTTYTMSRTPGQCFSLPFMLSLVRRPREKEAED